MSYFNYCITQHKLFKLQTHRSFICRYECDFFFCKTYNFMVFGVHVASILHFRFSCIFISFAKKKHTLSLIHTHKKNQTRHCWKRDQELCIAAFKYQRTALNRIIKKTFLFLCKKKKKQQKNEREVRSF